MERSIKVTEHDIRIMVLEAIKRLINESYGINDEMENKASALVAFIQKNIMKAPVEYDPRTQLNYRLLSYDHEFEEKKFSWTIIGYIYPDTENLEDNVDIQFSDGASTSDGSRMFFGWICFSMTEEGWFNYGEVADSIYHEMLQLFKAKEIGKESSDQEFNAITGMRYNTSTGLPKDIAVICYMPREDEQDAYINGLYGKIKEEFLEHQNINVGNIFYNSELCKKISEIKMALDNLSQSPIEKLAPYNTGKSSLTHKKIMNLGKKSITKIESKSNPNVEALPPVSV